MKGFKTSLRLWVALSVILLYVAAFSLLSWLHSRRARQAMEAQIQLTALQLADLTAGNLQDAMQSEDLDKAAAIIQDVSRMENISRLLVLDAESRVVLDSQNENRAAVLQPEAQGCAECHYLPEGERPRAARLETQPDLLRIGVPIMSAGRCQDCDPGEPTPIGVLLLDVSLLGVRQHLSADFTLDLLVFAGLSAAINSLCRGRFRRPPA